MQDQNPSDAIGLEIERREEVPERVRRCTTHHHACDCREWAHEQAIIAREQEIEEQARLLGTSGSREAELLARVAALEIGIREFVTKGHTDDCLFFLGECDCGIGTLAALLQEQTP